MLPSGGCCLTRFVTRGVGRRPGLSRRPSRAATPRRAGAGRHAAVNIAPATGWTADETYTLHCGPQLNDGAGDAWGKTLDVQFRVGKGQVDDTFAVSTAYDLAAMGSELFVAADTLGLAVIDASNPAHLVDIIPGNPAITFPFPFNDPVRGVAVDPHGRVLVVGGGVTGFGQLKIFDPQKLTPAVISAIADHPTDATQLYAAFHGSTILSDALTNATTMLPEGTPRRVAPLSDDVSLTWVGGWRRQSACRPDVDAARATAAARGHRRILVDRRRRRRQGESSGDAVRSFAGALRAGGCGGRRDVLGDALGASRRSARATREHCEPGLCGDPRRARCRW